MSNRLLYLSRGDILSLGVSPKHILQLVEDAFVEKSAGRIEMPPKVGVHPREDAFIHAMPAHLRDTDAVGVKWIAGYPTNSRLTGIPYLHGLVVLSDAETGRPTAVMDATWITEMRTAAATFVGIRRLTSAEPKVLGMIGCGRQAHSHLAMLDELYHACTVLLFDPVAQRVKECAAAIGDSRSVIVDTAAEATAADVVISSAPIRKHPSRAVSFADVRPHTILCAVDFDSTFGPDVAHGVARLTVDDKTQYLYYRDQGYFTGYPDDPVEVAEAETGVGTQLYVPLGVALADIAVAESLAARAEDQGVGQWLSL